MLSASYFSRPCCLSIALCILSRVQGMNFYWFFVGSPFYMYTRVVMLGDNPPKHAGVETKKKK
jgi:hypothetical protein